ncbi:unnamed protein product, partial [Nesidiocoris tenuis]
MQFVISRTTISEKGEDLLNYKRQETVLNITGCKQRSPQDRTRAYDLENQKFRQRAAAFLRRTDTFSKSIREFVEISQRIIVFVCIQRITDLKNASRISLPQDLYQITEVDAGMPCRPRGEDRYTNQLTKDFFEKQQLLGEIHRTQHFGPSGRILNQGSSGFFHKARVRCQLSTICPQFDHP